MAVKHSYFLKLDEDFLQDPEVQLFLEEKGKEAVFDYLMLLTRMRDYRDYDYMIPFSLIPIIARKDLGTTREKLEDTVNYCIKIGFFKVYEDDIDKVKFFYSERRQCDLRTWQVTSSRRSEAGKRGNDKRWNKEGDTDNED